MENGERFKKVESSTNVVSKRDDPNYHQVIGHVPADISSDFKAACVKKGISVSTGLEQALLLWLSKESHKEISEKPHQSSKNHSNKTLKSLSKTIASSSRRPTDRECINAARKVGVKPELVLQLRDRLFDEKNEK
jgi:hypothetical protein